MNCHLQCTLHWRLLCLHLQANLLQQDAHRPAAPANTSAGTEAGTKRGHGQILGTYLHTPWCQCMGDGRVYYWNTATGVSNYLMPAELHGMALIPYNITQVPPAKKHAAGRSGLNDQLGAFQGGDNRAVAVEQPTGAATAASGGGLSVAAAPADAATDRNSAGIAAPATVAEPGPVFIGDTDRQVAYPSSARQLEAAGRPAPQPAAVGGGAAPPEPQGQNMTDQLPPPGNQTVEGAPATAEVGIGELASINHWLRLSGLVDVCMPTQHLQAACRPEAEHTTNNSCCNPPGDAIASTAAQHVAV